MTEKGKNNKQQKRLQEAVFLYRKQWLRGHRMDLEEFCRGYPEFTDELHRCIEDFLLVWEVLHKNPEESEAKACPPIGGQLPEGSVLRDFKVVRMIASGGMANVYEGEQISLKRSVALKVLSSRQASSEIGLQRFKREVYAVSRLNHPNIVTVYSTGKEGNVHYIAQEFVEGGKTLADRIASLRSKNSPPKDKSFFHEIAMLMSQVARALAYAHAQGIVHRDVKPSNVLITKDNIPKVSDFGLAKRAEDLTLTTTGDISGTPFYMSPEQALGKKSEIDHRSDIFSLGITLYECLTLNRPFDGDTSLEVLHQISRAQPTPPRKSNPFAPDGLCRICSKAMEKEKDLRYQSMADLADDLDRFLKGREVLAKPPAKIIGLWKYLRRNAKLSVPWLLALVFLFILGFVIVSRLLPFYGYQYFDGFEKGSLDPDYWEHVPNLGKLQVREEQSYEGKYSAANVVDNWLGIRNKYVRFDSLSFYIEVYAKSVAAGGGAWFSLFSRKKKDEGSEGLVFQYYPANAKDSGITSETFTPTFWIYATEQGQRIDLTKTRPAKLEACQWLRHEMRRDKKGKITFTVTDESGQAETMKAFYNKPIDNLRFEMSVHGKSYVDNITLSGETDYNPFQ